MNEPASDTILARLTPAGKAAIATLGVVGPLAWTTVRALLQRRGAKELPEMARAGSLYQGRLGAVAGDSDEVMVHVRSDGPELDPSNSIMRPSIIPNPTRQWFLGLA